MSVPVDLAALHEQIARFGPNAFLVTTAPDGPPHVSSVIVETDGDDLRMGCGNTSRANVAARAEVSLLWPPGPDPGYSLIVDAVALGDPGPTLTVRPAHAVLHRVAGASDELPRCVPLEGP